MLCWCNMVLIPNILLSRHYIVYLSEFILQQDALFRSVLKFVSLGVVISHSRSMSLLISVPIPNQLLPLPILVAILAVSVQSPFPFQYHRVHCVLHIQYYSIPIPVVLKSCFLFPLQEPCTKSLCDMRHGDRLEGSLSTSSNGVTVSSTHSAGWASHLGKSRRGLLIKRQVRYYYCSLNKGHPLN